MSASILWNVVEKITIVLWECNVDVAVDGWIRSMEEGRCMVFFSGQNVHEGQHFIYTMQCNECMKMARTELVRRSGLQLNALNASCKFY